MNHLSVDEMILFVSMTEMTQENMTLAASVNGHIRQCKDCRQRIDGFQTIYDELTALHQCADVKKAMQERLPELLPKLELREN